MQVSREAYQILEESLSTHDPERLRRSAERLAPAMQIHGRKRFCEIPKDYSIQKVSVRANVRCIVLYPQALQDDCIADLPCTLPLTNLENFMLSITSQVTGFPRQTKLEIDPGSLCLPMSAPLHLSTRSFHAPQRPPNSMRHRPMLATAKLNNQRRCTLRVMLVLS